MLREKVPEALLIVVYYCVALKKADHMWWVKEKPENLLRTLLAELGTGWEVSSILICVTLQVLMIHSGMDGMAGRAGPRRKGSVQSRQYVDLINERLWPASGYSSCSDGEQIYEPIS